MTSDPAKRCAAGASKLAEIERTYPLPAMERFGWGSDQEEPELAVVQGGRQ
jgi:hypothetical protein